ncbi:MAG: TetR/AcrR family transcriptional regulator, partial [Gaiellaceae bacterium]
TRLPLSRDRILERAVQIADAEGVDALTMRRLADDLGFEAMSLYRHVKNKEDVLGGILDVVLAEIESPAAPGEWDAAIRRSAISVSDVLQRHAWATDVLMSPAGIRPARLAYMNDLLGRLREAGFSADMTYTAYHALDAHIFGFALWLASHSAVPPEVVERFARDFPLDGYPHLAEHRDQHLAEGPHQEVSAFELGLDLILDGLKKLRE